MTQFPDTLRQWRKTRRLSQLDLALEADVSARHISFLETGRARPSRQMITRLSEAMALPLSSRNHMLTGAGFAPRYMQRDWSSTEMAPVRDAVLHMLQSHSPWPAFAIDRLWFVQHMNDAARRLFWFAGISEGASMLDAMTGDVLPNLIENWGEVAHHTALRLRTESAALGGIRDLDQAADHLSANIKTGVRSHRPVIPVTFKTPELRISLFSTIAQFGTPEDLTLSDLRIELFFPADADSKATLTAMINTPEGQVL